MSSSSTPRAASSAPAALQPARQVVPAVEVAVVEVPVVAVVEVAAAVEEPR